MSSIDDHGLRPVPDRARASVASRPPRHHPFTVYPDDVLRAIRVATAAIADAEKPLSAAGRQLFAQAMDVVAERADIQAQIDAAEA